MWKTVAEAKEWENYLVVWYNKYLERLLALNETMNYKEFYPMETDYGSFKVKFLETKEKVCDYRFTSPGKTLTEDDFIGLKRIGDSDVYELSDPGGVLFNTNNYRVRYIIQFDYKELLSLNHVCVIPPGACQIAVANFDRDDRGKDYYIGFALLGNPVLSLPKGFKVADLFDLSHYYANVLKIGSNKLLIDKCSSLNTSYDLKESYIKEYRTSYENLIYGEASNFAECVKVLCVEDYVEVVRNTVRLRFEMDRIRSRIEGLHSGLQEGYDICQNPFSLTSLIAKVKGNYPYKGDFSEDYVYVYLTQDLFVNLESCLDEILPELSLCLNVRESSFDTSHITENVLMLKLFGGLNVQFIFTDMGRQELYAMLTDMLIKDEGIDE